jgi:hypothetical protein
LYFRSFFNRDKACPQSNKNPTTSKPRQRKQHHTRKTQKDSMAMNANLAMNDAEASRPRGWSSSEGSYSVNRESAEPSAKKSRCNRTRSQQAVYIGNYPGKQAASSDH